MVSYIRTEKIREVLRQQKLGKKLKNVHRNKVVRTLNHSTGPTNNNWKGGFYINQDGYKKIRVNGTYILEHRLIMEKHFGRPLTKEEHVHHINGIKTDNRIKNLVVTTRKHHIQIHWQQPGERERRSEAISRIRKNRFWSTKKKLSS